jgi:hypothetical protein
MPNQTGGMVLGWLPLKIVSGDPDDGRQAKNKEKGMKLKNNLL